MIWERTQTTTALKSGQREASVQSTRNIFSMPFHRLGSVIQIQTQFANVASFLPLMHEPHSSEYFAM